MASSCFEQWLCWADEAHKVALFGRCRRVILCSFRHIPVRNRPPNPQQIMRPDTRPSHLLLCDKLPGDQRVHNPILATTYTNLGAPGDLHRPRSSSHLRLHGAAMTFKNINNFRILPSPPDKSQGCRTGASLHLSICFLNFVKFLLTNVSHRVSFPKSVKG